MDENITNQAPDSNTATSSAEMSQTAILRLKAAEQTDTQKTNSISDTGYSIIDAYQQTIREQQAFLSKQRKEYHTFKVIKITISIVLLLTVVFAFLYFLLTHLPEKESKKSTLELLCESKWTVEELGSFTFTDDLTVSRKDAGTLENGTFELTNDNVLIMHFKNEDLSYLIEYDKDGAMRWVHSYNGFENVIYPNPVPVR